MTQTISKVTAATLGVALLAATFIVFAPTASANGHRGGGGGDDTNVSNSNRAMVMNMSVVGASTGDNTTNGGRGGDGGNARGGDAGNGGRGGDAGSITSGAATAVGTVRNDVNNNRNVIESCGCDNGGRHGHGSQGDNDQDVRVQNSNRAMVGNMLIVDASTGGNDADGGRGGDGGNTRDQHRMIFLQGPHGHGHGQAGSNDGGNAGAAGTGGTIRTGVAVSDGLITNVVNQNVTRVNAGHRGLQTL